MRNSLKLLFVDLINNRLDFFDDLIELFWLFFYLNTVSIFAVIKINKLKIIQMNGYMLKKI